MENKAYREDEIDMFEFIAIVIKHKYLIVSIVLVSIVAAFGYLYFFKKRITPIYSIKFTFTGLNVPKIEPVEHFESLNKKLQNIKGEFRTYLRYWFDSQNYKSLLQKKRNMIKLPNIKVGDGGSFLELQMLYPDAQEGMSIMSDITRFLISSDRSQAFIAKIKMLLNREKELLQIEANTERDRYEETLLGYNALGAKLESVNEIIITMERYLEGIENDKPGDLVIAMEFVDVLREYEHQLQNWLRNLKQELIDIDRQHNLQRLDLETLSNEIKGMGQMFDYEKPFYEEIYTNKQVSKTKTVGLFAIIGLFVGIIVAFLSGVRERRFA